MISLIITETIKGYGAKDKWMKMHTFEEKFESIKKAKEWLKERYEKCKKSKIYIDSKNADDFHCGYIYHFHNEDISHIPAVKWIQNDWVEFRESKIINLEKA